MIPARLGVPLFVVAARDDRGRALLTAERLMQMVSRWAADFSEQDWLIDPDGGVALFRPSFALHDADNPLGMILRGNLRVADDAINGIESLGASMADDAEGLLRSLRGDFALAHWQGGRRRLILARDPLGRRSIFYRMTGDFLLFCSEPGPLYRCGGAGPVTVDRRSLFWFLSFGGPLPGSTLVEGVGQLRAGHWLSWTPGQPLLEHRYWTPLGGPRPILEGGVFASAVIERLQTALVNEPGGDNRAMALSGGIDSSLLLALAVAIDRRPSIAINVRFEAGLDANEDDYAAFAASHFGIPFRRVTLDAPRALRVLEQVVGELPEPCAAWAALSHTALLQGLREEQCDHLCSGFGADEIFGGYDHFRIAAGAAIRAARRLGAPRGRALHAAAALDPTKLAARVFFPGVARFFDDRALARGLRAPFSRWRHDVWQRDFYEQCYRIDPEAEPIQTMVAHECQHRIPDIVLKSFEPLAARYGVFTAYPFLDPDLCRMAAQLRLTDRYRTGGGQFALERRRLLPEYKWALARIAAAYLPVALIRRPRKSYTAPFALWMRDPIFARRVIAMIADSRLWGLGMLRRSALDESVRELETGPGPNAHRLWCLLVLARWCDVHRAH